MHITNNGLFKRSRFIFLSILSFFQGCTYDSAPEIDPNISAVSYSQEIKPIIEANCYRCHSATSTDPDKPGYAFFDDFDELKYFALKKSVFNPAYTTLQGRIRHIEIPGMPFNEDPLPEEEIQLIELWIKAGAPNN